MEKIQKELVKTLLNAIIEDGKAGVSNAVQDLNVDRLDQETSKIDYAVRELINLQEDEDGFNFHIFGKWLTNSNPYANSIENCIRGMLDFYEGVLNEGVEPGEKVAYFDFKDSEIKELAYKMEKETAYKFKEALEPYFKGGSLPEKVFDEVATEFFNLKN